MSLRPRLESVASRGSVAPAAALRAHAAERTAAVMTALGSRGGASAAAAASRASARCGSSVSTHRRHGWSLVIELRTAAPMISGATFAGGTARPEAGFSVAGTCRVRSQKRKWATPQASSADSTCRSIGNSTRGGPEASSGVRRSMWVKSIGVPPSFTARLRRRRRAGSVMRVSCHIWRCKPHAKATTARNTG